MKINSAVLTDGYKLDHRRQYPNGTERVYSTWIPRSNRHYPEADKIVVFGIQYAMKFINDHWNEGFFTENFDTIKSSWLKRINNFLGPNQIGYQHLEDLYVLGYLPIEVRALPEGTVTKPGIPHATFVNTNDNFAWIVNYLETLFSCMAWLPSTSATTARLSNKAIHQHAIGTGWSKEQMEAIPFLIHDFSMRGMQGLDSAIASGMGHLTSYTGSDSLPAIDGVEYYYSSDSDKECIAMGVPATEHSVMCAGGDENEVETFRRLLKLYPTGFISIVSDTWDYWNVITNILPQLKDEIMARDGRLVIRPDSGNPVDIICGKLEKVKTSQPGVYTTDWADDIEGKGTYELLWDIFGGTTNEKGFKVLDSHIGIIYGDAITLERQEEIYKRLEFKEFAATNLVLGFGSYTYASKTRDSLGWALKTTAVKINGEWKEVFKDPKTVVGMPKKSLRGFVNVYKDDHNEYQVEDQQTIYDNPNGALQCIYEDGEFVKTTTLVEIREQIKQSLN